MSHTLSRRTFLKGSAAAAAILGTAGAASTFDLVPLEAHADTAVETKKCFNCCPRNCYDTCSIVSTVEDGVLKTVTGNPDNTYTDGRLCVKGYSYPRRVYSPDRIKYPMRQTAKGSGEWEQITWDEAIDIIARKIVEIQQEDGNALSVCLNKYSGNFNTLTYGIEGFFTSIGHTTRCAGTPCWPAGIDSQTFDMGTLLNSDPESMRKSKMIIVWGANPAWNAVHSQRILADCKDAGCKIVVIDPINTDTACKVADQFIEINASTDGALALGMCKWVIDNGKVDQAWLSANAIGAQEFIDYVNKNVTLEWASEKTGVPVEVIEQLAKDYTTLEPACIWIGFGMQRHANGGATVRNIDALVALTGNIGKVGAGANYGQLDSWLANYGIQGAVGPKTDNVEADRSFNINNFGADLLNADPKIKLLWIACRNPMAQDPETDVVRQAFESVELVVTVDQFMGPSAQWSDLVLPCCTIFETWGVHASYWHYWMNANEQAIEPMYESKCDHDIFCMLADRMNELSPGSSTYPSGKSIKDFAMGEVADKALEMFGCATTEEFFAKGTCKVTGYDAAWADGKFRTPSGKYEFYSEAAATTGNHLLPVYREEYKAPEGYPVRLINPHWKYGLHSQFQNLDWMMNVQSEPYCEIGPKLAAEYGIEEGDAMRLESPIGYLTIAARITDTAPANSVVVYEAWFKDNDFNVNYLVPALPADMGAYATGVPGVSYHDAFVKISKA